MNMFQWEKMYHLSIDTIRHDSSLTLVLDVIGLVELGKAPGKSSAD